MALTIPLLVTLGILTGGRLRAHTNDPRPSRGRSLVMLIALGMLVGAAPQAVREAPPADFAAVIRGVRPRGFGAVPYKLLAPTPGGREWYVSPTGNDSAPGTRAAPLRAIDRAAQLARAGDVVTIAPGTYAESVRVRNSGTPEKRIVFQAEQRGAVVLTGGRHTFQPAFWTGGPEPRGQWYVTVRGLVFRRYSDPLSTENAIAAVRASKGWTIEDDLFDESGRTGVEIRDSEVTIVRSTFQYNYVNAITSWSPTRKSVSPTDPNYTPLTGVRLADLVLRGNNTTPTPLTDDVGEYVLKLWGTRGAVIENVESYENNGPGLWLDTQNTDFVIRDNYLHDNRPVAGKASRGRGIFIEINWARGLVEHNVIMDNSGAGITVANSAGVEVRGNLLVGNDHCLALISARRKTAPGGRPLYPLSDVAFHDNLCGGWRTAAVGTVGGSFEAPQRMAIRADGNVYGPTTSAVLVQWPGVGALSALSEVRARLGWETAGRIGKVTAP